MDQGVLQGGVNAFLKHTQTLTKDLLFFFFLTKGNQILSVGVDIKRPLCSSLVGCPPKALVHSSGQSDTTIRKQENQATLISIRQ